MANGLERVVGPAALFLGAIKRVTNCVIVGRGAKLTFELLKVRAGLAVRAGSEPRQGNRFAISLSQFVGSLKIIFAGIVLGDAEPGVRQPIAMLFSRSSELGGVAAI